MRTLLSLAAAIAITAALPAVASAQPAGPADTVSGGRPTTSENVQRGRGAATADATADTGGALTVSASAQAGRPLLGLLGGRSTAAATAGVTGTVAVTEGTYTVTFTYEDTTAATTAEPGAAATVIANSVATFTSADDTDPTPRPTIDFTVVDQDGGDLVVELEVVVPEAGSLFTVNRLIADATSTRAGAEASATATTDGTTVSVARTG